jgi:hypothetical protein
MDAVLVVGFNNWGKSRTVRDLFGKGPTGCFHRRRAYSIAGVNARFSVAVCSNDDLGMVKYLDAITQLVSLTANNYTQHIFSTLCPSREINNNARTILNHPIFISMNTAVRLFAEQLGVSGSTRWG